MESHGLTALAFAEKLGIERSGLSHLYNGRNKPSLELIMKVIEAFPEVSLEWLLRGISPESNEKRGGQVNIDLPDDASPIIISDATEANPKSNVTVVTNELLIDDKCNQEKIEQLNRDRKKSPSVSNMATEGAKMKTTVQGIVVLKSDGTFSYYNQGQ